MEQDQNLPFIEEIMRQFAEETGLLGGRKPQRYLWTDAFAVCNYLELHHRTGNQKYRTYALDLVDQVHHVLGRYREDDRRRGWISGLDESEGEKHPTCGGLRIGKNLPERLPHEPEDDQLEWDRDGQYFHYLTKWVHALHQVAVRTNTPVYDTWAYELAVAAHEAFTYRPATGTSKRMFWKMSTDLSRPLVSAMGRHDPVDGYLSYLELQDDAPAALQKEIADMEAICKNWDLSTDDPLGLGGLLADALRLVKLENRGRSVLPGLLEDLLKAAKAGIVLFSDQNSLHNPIEYRLPFRELGLSIGLQAVPAIDQYLKKNAAQSAINPSGRLLHELSDYSLLCVIIEKSWLHPENRRSVAWKTHNDINAVMLATSLAPEGFFGR
jgi:hypothetical protein